MVLEHKFDIKMGKAICYSGFRDGQNPGNGTFPSYEEVEEDLRILAEEWCYIRLYDVDQHGQTVLKVIEEQQLPIKVLLGICLGAEVVNPNCPWGADYTDNELKSNAEANEAQILQLIDLANDYPEIVVAVSTGNEATVEWTDHLVPVEKILSYVTMIRESANQPITFCENYSPWHEKLTDLAEALDFISVHTYPLWEYKSIEEAMAYTIDNVESIRRRYPHKPIVITEAGWATNSNGRGMPPENANEGYQRQYVEALIEWSLATETLTFVFEAFDETWKGSEDPLEPEKHWGLYTMDRQPKKIIEEGNMLKRCV